ncbi:Glycoside hydrolase family 93 protein [Pleurostoma richardsiae]|uniref:Glycoside hydrolase family 93 protein n=1 Tax=Pleurostoma richardsiae TaxID=41990 RepID=A0AA38RQ81_9PEZI|nr:Glycoside hydrolase family 93 protein [Pleurostoma richardsiae]
MLSSLTVAALGLLASLVEAAPHKPYATTFSNNVIFTPPSNYTDPRVLYARSVELQDGTLLATWENYSPEPPPVYFPIFKSKDYGVSWKMISKVTDQGYGWGLRYQPFLYELPVPFGGFAAGTVLLAGSSIPTDLSKTQIDLYASTDRGYSWTFVSHVAAGGRAVPDNGETPVWEPFLMMYKDQIVMYYSDQRDPNHGQKLVHQTSKDLKSWDAVVDDVAYANYTARPGMTTVTKLPNGKYIMTYEYGGGPGFSSYSFPVYYRISDDPLKFNSAPGHALVAEGTTPFSSPYITWSSAGGRDGTIVVSDGTHQQIFVNRALGADDKWEWYSVPQLVAYTRHLRVFKDDPSKLLIMGAGHLPPSTTNNVSLSVVDLGKTIGLY